MDEIKLHQFTEKLALSGYSRRVTKDWPAYVRLFFKYLEEKENVRSLDEVTPAHLKAYHSYLHYGKLKKGSYISSATVCARLLAVKSFYRVMYGEGLLKQDYASLITLPKRKKPLPKHVPTEEDMRQLLDSIKPDNPITIRDRALLELMYASGIRNEELRSLSINDLDLTEKTVLVHGKGSKDRVVPVGDWVLPYLREYLEAGRPKLLKQREPVELIFVSKNGRKITNANLGDLVKKYGRYAHLSIPLTPHRFRHACATHLLKAGADIRYVQELLGHADLSSTQIYTKLDISFLKQAHRKYHPREKQDGSGAE
jgi:site-specific recombinase XerD